MVASVSNARGKGVCPSGDVSTKTHLRFFTKSARFCSGASLLLFITRRRVLCRGASFVRAAAVDEVRRGGNGRVVELVGRRS